MTLWRQWLTSIAAWTLNLRWSGCSSTWMTLTLMRQSAMRRWSLLWRLLAARSMRRSRTQWHSALKMRAKTTSAHSRRLVANMRLSLGISATRAVWSILRAVVMCVLAFVTRDTNWVIQWRQWGMYSEQTNYDRETDVSSKVLLWLRHFTILQM